MSNPFREESYIFQLSVFQRKNKGSSENDFLNNRIEFYENLIKENIELKDSNLKIKIENQLIDFVGHKEYSRYFEYVYLKEIRIRNDNIKEGKKFIEFYRKKIKLLKILSGYDLKENPYVRIFVNHFSYKLFEELQKIVKNDLADYSFIYRKMISEEFIYKDVGESEFRRFLNDNFEVSIDKMKQLYLCTTEKKEQLYTTIKNSIL